MYLALYTHTHTDTHTDTHINSAKEMLLIPFYREFNWGLLLAGKYWGGCDTQGGSYFPTGIMFLLF